MALPTLPHGRIEMCGALGTGKSSLALVLQRFGASVLYEKVAENPFLVPYYRDKPRFAFEKDVFFLIAYVHDVKATQQQQSCIVHDYAMVLNKAYFDLSLQSGAERQAWLAMYEHVVSHLPPPDLIVHLHCPLDVQMERIIRRGRGMEQGIPKDFLVSLNDSIQRNLDAASKYSRILSIDTSLVDFVNEPAAGILMASKVGEALSRAKRGDARPDLKIVNA